MRGSIAPETSEIQSETYLNATNPTTPNMGRVESLFSLAEQQTASQKKFKFLDKIQKEDDKNW
jgi:hypothetical protein